MNEILLQLPFSDSEIDFKNYTGSLFKLSAQHGLLSPSKQAEIRSVFDKEFYKIASQYTKSESSTISSKRAELLYVSVLYQSDIFLLNLRDTKKALEAMQNIPMGEILKKGQVALLKCFEEAKVAFSRCYRSMLNIHIPEYRFVMDKAFFEFCKKYSARFDALNIVTNIDYPLLHCYGYELNTQGVMFIKEYYTSLMLENEFCKYFNEEDIVTLLENHSRIYNCHYTESLCNITEVVLVNMLAGALLSKPIFSIYLNQEDVHVLVDKYTYLSANDFTVVTKNAFAPYYKAIKNPMIVKYLRAFIPEFVTSFQTRIRSGGINKFIVCCK